MPRTILNRELVSSLLPRYEAGALDLPDEFGGHHHAWIRIWRFALSFDTAKYASEVAPLDRKALGEGGWEAFERGLPISASLSEFRAMLEHAYYLFGNGHVTSAAQARYIDALLDGIHGELTSGKRRPREQPDCYEPALGYESWSEGRTKYRFVFTPKGDKRGRDLYDSIAGILLREVRAPFFISGLFLYPPGYDVERKSPPQATAKLSLGVHGDGRAERAEEELHRLIRRVLEDVADPSAAQ